jgi:catechol 2,3-dioxygenase-like lactoylglutathione lyase family enzyme
MEQRVHFITLGTPDLEAARRFYVGGLGWKPTFEVDGEVVFIQVGPGLLLSLWDRDAMAQDIGAPVTPGSAVTFAHNVDSDDAVAQVLADAEAAGATVLKPAQQAFFGGVQGYFEDPLGFRWEVAHNPGWAVEPDGTVRIGPSQDQ